MILETNTTQSYKQSYEQSLKETNMQNRKINMHEIFLEQSRLLRIARPYILTSSIIHQTIPPIPLLYRQSNNEEINEKYRLEAKYLNARKHTPKYIKDLHCVRKTLSPIYKVLIELWCCKFGHSIYTGLPMIIDYLCDETYMYLEL